MSAPTTRARRWLAALAAAGVALALPVVAAAPATAEPANLVVNGSFEDGTVAPWSQWPAGAVLVTSSGAGHGDAADGTRFAAYPANSSL